MMRAMLLAMAALAAPAVGQSNAIASRNCKGCASRRSQGRDPCSSVGKAEAAASSPRQCQSLASGFRPSEVLHCNLAGAIETIADDEP
eukprot:667336-Hanusia_phi.AAC.6